MNKVFIVIISLIGVSISFAFGSIDLQSENENNSMRTISIHSVAREKMPGWEKQVIELYGDESGNAIPVIFRGGANDWEAAAWTPEYFAERFGDKEIVVVPQRYFEEGLDANNKEDKLKVIYTTMRDHINDVMNNPKNACYFFAELNYNATKEGLIADANAENISEALIRDSVFIHTYLDLGLQTRFPQSIIKTYKKDRYYSFMIGSSNTVTSLHNHGSTFLAQIYGRKLATLVHPKDIDKCFCSLTNEEEGDGFVSRCAVDILKPDFEKYPELKEIEIYQTILEPGDLLYIPEGWLHDIRGLSTSISVASGF